MPLPTRRTLLNAGAFASISAATGAMAGGAGRPFFARHHLPVGVQLYTLGAALQADLDGTLAGVAKIGFKTLEMAGYLGHAPAQLRAAFDRAGLTCTSSHVQARPLSADPSLAGDVARVAADAHVIGADYVVMPIFYIPDRFEMKPAPGEGVGDFLGRLGGQMTADDWKFCADFLNAKGAALKAAGLRFAYHNHNIELRPLGATNGYELLLKHTDPALVDFEMDVGWVTAGGADPLALLRDHPGRFRLMHVKDVTADTQTNYALHQSPTEVGRGVIDWKSILPAAFAAGVTRFFVEQEPPYPGPPIDSVAKSFRYLNRLAL